MSAEEKLFRPPSPETLAWVARALGRGARVVSLRRMRLGSTAMHAVDVRDARGETHQLALRRYVRADRLRRDAHYSPRREVAALTLLAGSDVPAPRLIAADPNATECDVPTLLTTRMPGRPPQRVQDVAVLTQLAEVLPRVHAIDRRASDALPQYRPYYRVPASPPPWSRFPGAWRAAFRALRHRPPSHRGALIHRDYHFGNTLWSRGRLTGVVDWTSASWGPPGIDLGCMRWNLARFGSVRLADRFASAYRAVAGDEHRHPYWDLRTAVDGIPDLDDPPREIARFDAYVARLAAELS